MSTAVLERSIASPELINQQTSWGIAGEMYPEELFRSRQQTADILGCMWVRNYAEVNGLDENGDRERANHTTLMTSIQLAAMGDELGLKQLTLNANLDVFERDAKKGGVSEVFFDIDPDYGLVQDGRALTDIVGNVLRVQAVEGEMKRRSMHEHTNVGVLNELQRIGVLKNHYALVWSLASKSKQVRDEYNFSEDEMFSSVQLATEKGDQFSLETGLVAGKKTQDSERHDFDSVKQLLANHGIDIADVDPTELVGKVFLFPKEELPNGIVDLVEEYDDISGGTFYGLDQPRQDYVEHAKASKTKDYSAITNRIVKQLIKEVHNFKQPMDAIFRLDELSSQYSIDNAAVDQSVDVKIFGPTAAIHVQEARTHMRDGNMYQADISLDKAKKTSTDSSCPLRKTADSPQNDAEGSLGESEDTVSGERKKMTCPYCKETTYGDPCDSSVTCNNCDACASDSTEKNFKKAETYKMNKIKKKDQSHFDIIFDGMVRNLKIKKTQDDQ